MKMGSENFMGTTKRKYYNVTVPSTTEIGPYSTDVREDEEGSKAKAALDCYNDFRDDYKLPPLKRMPNGTKYKLIHHRFVKP